MSFYRRDSTSTPRPFNFPASNQQYMSTGYRPTGFNIPDAGFRPGSAPQNTQNYSDAPGQEPQYKPVKIPIKIVKSENTHNQEDKPSVPKKDYPKNTDQELDEKMPKIDKTEKNFSEKPTKIPLKTQVSQTILHSEISSYHDEILSYALNIEELKIKLLRESNMDIKTLKDYQIMARKFAEYIYKIIEKLDVIDNPGSDEDMHFKLSKKVILSTAMLWVERADKIGNR